MKTKFYKISPKDWGKMRFFGVFRFSPCPCGCATKGGFGINLLIMGVSVQHEH